VFIVFPDDIPEFIPKKPEHVIKIKVGMMGNSFRVGNSSTFSEVRDYMEMHLRTRWTRRKRRKKLYWI